MEKTLAMHLADQREEIAKDIEAWGIVSSYSPLSTIGMAQDSAFRQAREEYIKIVRKTPYGKL
jgi:hypothetical protein